MCLFFSYQLRNTTFPACDWGRWGGGGQDRADQPQSSPHKRMEFYSAICPRGSTPELVTLYSPVWAFIQPDLGSGGGGGEIGLPPLHVVLYSTVCSKGSKPGVGCTVGPDMGQQDNPGLIWGLVGSRGFFPPPLLAMLHLTIHPRASCILEPYRSPKYEDGMAGGGVQSRPDAGGKGGGKMTHGLLKEFGWPQSCMGGVLSPHPSPQWHHSAAAHPHGHQS